MDDLDLTIGPPEAPTAGFDPEDPEDFHELGDDLDVPEVPEVVVRGLLAALGAGANQLTEHPDLWRFTPHELDDLTPPLTRFINARPRLRAIAHRGDALSMGVILAGYLGRNAAIIKETRNANEHGQDGPRVGGGWSGPVGLVGDGPGPEHGDRVP